MECNLLATGIMTKSSSCIASKLGFFQLCIVMRLL